MTLLYHLSTENSPKGEFQVIPIPDFINCCPLLVTNKVQILEHDSKAGLTEPVVLYADEETTGYAHTFSKQLIDQTNVHIYRGRFSLINVGYVERL